MAIIELKIEDGKYATIEEAAKFYRVEASEYCDKAIGNFIDSYTDIVIREMFGSEPSPAAQRIEQTLFGGAYECQLEKKKRNKRIRKLKNKS